MQNEFMRLFEFLSQMSTFTTKATTKTHLLLPGAGVYN
jgi:hypothetical protein